MTYSLLNIVKNNYLFNNVHRMHDSSLRSPLRVDEILVPMASCLSLFSKSSPRVFTNRGNLYFSLISGD